MSRHGVTLIELTVVLLLLSLMAGMSGVAWSSLRPARDSSGAGLLARGRGRALLTGTAIRVAPPGSDSSATPAVVRFLPDGRAIGSGVDPILGTPIRHAH